VRERRGDGAMNALFVLMGLLVLSYIGSFLVGGRSVRGVGLPSGAEYIALGFVLGPHVLGILERSMLVSFEPLVHVALGWLALVIGLDFGFAGDRRVRGRSMVFGIVSALVTGGLTMGLELALLRRVPLVASRADALLLAGALAVACAETTRHTVRWVVERHGARGRLANLLTELSHADDAIPLLGLAVLFAAAQRDVELALHMPAIGWMGVTVALGFVLGAVSALLLGAKFRVHTTWGVLFGASLLAIGVATRLGLASLAVAFSMGVAMAMVSPHRGDLRAIVAPTERPVLLPALLLAGARVDLGVLRDRRVALVVAAAIAARVAGKLVSGILLRGTRAARSASSLVGLGLLSSGALSVSIGLAVALRFPGTFGDTVLVTAAIAAVFGEFVAPAALRRVLARAGELPDAPPVASGAAPAAASAEVRE
jgi:hypothetical protein